jgi:uncharacterized protein (DUF952 family)
MLLPGLGHPIWTRRETSVDEVTGLVHHTDAARVVVNVNRRLASWVRRRLLLVHLDRELMQQSRCLRPSADCQR